MELLLLPLVCAAVVQLLIGIACAIGYRHARRPATALVGAAACCLIVALFGDSFLMAIHTPSSFDAVADGFLLDGVHWTATVGLLALGCAMCLWLALAIPRRSCE